MYKVYLGPRQYVPSGFPRGTPRPCITERIKRDNPQPQPDTGVPCELPLGDDEDYEGPTTVIRDNPAKDRGYEIIVPYDGVVDDTIDSPGTETPPEDLPTEEIRRPFRFSLDALVRQ